MTRPADPLGAGFHQTGYDLDAEPVVLTPEQITGATATVRRFATDATDLDQLLKMCGLRDGKVTVVPSLLPCGHDTTTAYRNTAAGGRGLVCRPCVASYKSRKATVR